MYDHRGKAIREIHHVLDNERLRNTDYALLIVLMLLFGEVSFTYTLVVHLRSVMCAESLIYVSGSGDKPSHQTGRNILKELAR